MVNYINRIELKLINFYNRIRNLYYKYQLLQKIYNKYYFKQKILINIKLIFKIKCKYWNKKMDLKMFCNNNKMNIILIQFILLKI